MATSNASTMMSRIPAWPAFTSLAERKLTSVRASRAVRGVLRVAEDNPEALLLTPCKQYVTRIGKAAKFTSELKSISGIIIDARHEILKPAFESREESPLFAIESTSRLSLLDEELRPQQVERFGHALQRFKRVRQANGSVGQRVVKVVRDPAKDLGIDVDHLRATGAGCAIERRLFAHLFPPLSPATADEGKSATPPTAPGAKNDLERWTAALNERDLMRSGWNPRQLRGVAEAALDIVDHVLYPLVTSRITEHGHCTLQWLLLESRWSSVSHVLPSFTQTVADSAPLVVHGVCVFPRSVDEARSLWNQRRQQLSTAQGTTPTAVLPETVFGVMHPSTASERAAVRCSVEAAVASSGWS
jgi:hypothetical protein